MGYSICMMGDFQNGPMFSNILCFLWRFFAPNKSKGFVKWILTVFWNFNFSLKVRIFHGL